MRAKFSNLLWGLFFVIIGLGFAGSAFGLWEFQLFFTGWWTLFIIVPCGISLIQNGFRVWPTAGLILGILLLASSRGYIDASVIGKLIVPVIFILIGLSIIFKNWLLKDINRIHVKYQGGNSEYSAIFAGRRDRVTGEKFMGTTINAIFGGVDLDLRNAIIEEDVLINATAVFGGINIFVPPNVKVKVSNVPIFGGVDCKVMDPVDSNAPTILINSTCMFGGIDIK
jgi:predicted membrane protein